LKPEISATPYGFIHENVIDKDHSNEDKLNNKKK